MLTATTVPAASTMKYMVGLFSKTSRHCSSLCRSASSARFAAVTSITAPTNSSSPDLSLSAWATTWTCLTEPSGITKRYSRSKSFPSCDARSKDGNDFDLEYRLVMPDGSVKHVHVVAHAERDKSGELEFVGAVMDVTAAKRAEEALRQSEEQWRDVFENNPTMYFMVDAAGKVIAVNPFGAEPLGYNVDELVSQPRLGVFYEVDREAAERNVALCLEQIGRAKSWGARK